MKYKFELWANLMKTVEIEADSEEEAYDEMLEILYDVDFSDAEEIGEREHNLVS